MTTMLSYIYWYIAHHYYTMVFTIFKIVLSTLILIIAIATQLDFKDGNLLVHRTANLNIPIDKCYRKVSDFLEYPEWMSLVSDVASLDLPTAINVGTEFTTVTNIGILGSFEQRNIVSTVVRNKKFGFITHSFVRTETQFNVSSDAQWKCVLGLVIQSKQSSSIIKRLSVPILRLYYGNWATQSLIMFKMKMS